MMEKQRRRQNYIATIGRRHTCWGRIRAWIQISSNHKKENFNWRTVFQYSWRTVLWTVIKFYMWYNNIYEAIFRFHHGLFWDIHYRETVFVRMPFAILTSVAEANIDCPFHRTRTEPYKLCFYELFEGFYTYGQYKDTLYFSY